MTDGAASLLDASENESETALRVKDLRVRYGRGRDVLYAVDRVNIEVSLGGTLGIIGESGSGKSTLIKAIAGLAPISDGTVEIADRSGALRAARSSVGRGGNVQMVFQDSSLALNALRPVWQSVAEPIEPNHLRMPRKLRDEAIDLLEQVGLSADLADRRPAQMSGGQRQRVTIARAVASKAPIVMCDEPVAALDISLQADVLKLLDELQMRLNLTYVFISHDVSSIARIADDVGVMYLGQLVEVGPVDAVLNYPRHPYTQALIRAVPRLRVDAGRMIPLEGEIPDARRPPSGCRFRTRCPFAQEICSSKAPQVEPLEDESVEGRSHVTACHFWQDIRDGRIPVRAAAE